MYPPVITTNKWREGAREKAQSNMRKLMCKTNAREKKNMSNKERKVKYAEIMLETPVQIDDINYKHCSFCRAIAI